MFLKYLGHGCFHRVVLLISPSVMGEEQPQEKMVHPTVGCVDRYADLRFHFHLFLEGVRLASATGMIFPCTTLGLFYFFSVGYSSTPE